MILIVGGACQGKKAYAREQYGESHTIMEDYHKQVERELREGKNPLTEAKKLLETRDNLVIVSDELGYGIVPIDKFDRTYREENGRVNCYLAEQATQVFRVVCGIGTRIK